MKTFEDYWKRGKYEEAIKLYKKAGKPFYLADQVGHYYERKGLMAQAMAEYELLMAEYLKMKILPLPKGPAELYKLGKWFKERNPTKARKYLSLYLRTEECKSDPAFRMPHKEAANRLLSAIYPSLKNKVETHLKRRYLRFVSVRFKNYGVFQGANEFRFGHNQTIIIGSCGTGKTTLAETLENLGPKAKIAANGYASVKTEGDRWFVRPYKDLIILKSEDVMGFILKYQKLPAVKDKARMNFQKILSKKPRKIQIHQDLNPKLMASGERQALYYAYAFAAREVLGLDAPVVMDDPYSRLDPELKQGLRSFLKGQSCQQILLGSDHSLSKADHADYVLLSESK